jgi:MoaA/NifB/PqqE/SkfB family radical SAM enzyme
MIAEKSATGLSGLAEVVRKKQRQISRSISVWKRYPRHVRAVLEHGTLRKLLNVLRVEAEMRRRAVVLRGRPYYYFVDVCNVCNLRCPLCPTGTYELNRHQGMMSFEEYKAILSQIEPYAMEVCLYNWGEPFLNKDIFKIIRHTADLNIGTNLSTNFTTLEPSDMDKVAESGLEYLVVSLDGTTQDVYSEYRVRGDIDLVLANIQALVEARQRLKSRTPFIEWQYLVFKHNEHQMDEARRMARELKVDLLRFTSPGMPFEKTFDQELADKWMPIDPKWWRLNPKRIRDEGYLWEDPCFYLYRSMTVNPRGGVTPCCIVYHGEHDFGNLLETDLESLWNNNLYRAARSLFSRRGDPREAFTVCHM